MCKILGQEDIKPHKVRYYLERRDAEFEQKMAQVLWKSSEVGSGTGLQEPGTGFATRAKRSCDLRARS